MDKEGTVEAECGTEETKLADDAKDILRSEGVKNMPTLWDLVYYIKSSTES